MKSNQKLTVLFWHRKSKADANGLAPIICRISIDGSEAEFSIGKKVSNVCFGGKNGKTCYITLQDRGCLETFKALHPGREWAMMKAFSEEK